MKNLSASVLISTSTKQQISTIESKPIKSTSKSHISHSRHELSHRNNKDKDENNELDTHNPSTKTLRNSPNHSHPCVIPLNNCDSIDSQNKKRINDHKNVSLFGIDLSHLNAYWQGIILTIIILFGFIAIGYVEEGFKFEFENFSYGWFMTAIELIIFSIFAMIERLFKSLTKITSAVYLSSASTIHLNIPSNEQLESETVNLLNNNNNNNDDEILISDKKSNGPKLTIENKNIIKNDVSNTNSNSNSSKILLLFKINWFNVIFEKQMGIKYHLIVASAMMCSRALTNIALLLLNYPTQVIFKSLKLISVMIGSVCCLKKEYHKCEYIAAPLLVISAVLFTLGDAHQLNFNVLGIIVVLLSLVFDAIHANSQQYILQAKTERDTTMELLVYSNMIAGVFAGIISIFVGEINEIIYNYLPNQPDNTLYKLFLWFIIRVACLYIGVSAFVVFTKRFGALYAVTITTVRKILTVILSYIFYPGKKVFIPLQHGIGTLFFILSLSLWGMGTVKKKQKW